MSIAVSCFINCVSSLSTEIGEASYEAPYKSNYHDGNSKERRGQQRSKTGLIKSYPSVQRLINRKTVYVRLLQPCFFQN